MVTFCTGVIRDADDMLVLEAYFDSSSSMIREEEDFLGLVSKDFYESYLLRVVMAPAFFLSAILFGAFD
jgi:hypothetical protein